MNTNLPPSARLTLYLAAAVDRALPPILRAGARAAAREIDVRKAPPSDPSLRGLIAGAFLTDAGRAAAREAIPAPGAGLFPLVVDDLLRRLRGQGRPCADVTCVPAEGGGYRVSWEGDGWASFSRQSPDRDGAARNRGELIDAALALGLVVEQEGAPSLLLAPRPPEAVAEEEPEAEEPELPLDRLLRDGPRRAPTAAEIIAALEDREPTAEERADDASLFSVMSGGDAPDAGRAWVAPEVF